MNELTSTQLAYLAGLIDGEGTIRISTRNSVVLGICSTDNRYLRDVHALIGVGSVYTHNERVGANHKQPTRIKVGGREATEVLESVLPFLMIKHDEALLAVVYQELVGVGSRALVPEHITTTRAFIKERLKAYKHTNRPCSIPPLFTHVSEESKAYLAGLVDGEGHISLMKNTHNSFRLRIGVTSTDIPLLSFWRDKLKLGGCYVTRPNDYPRRPCGKWLMNSNQADAFLEMIQPYLILKARRAEIAREFQSLMRTKGSIEAKTALYDELRTLNRRGIDPEPVGATARIHCLPPVNIAA